MRRQCVAPLQTLAIRRDRWADRLIDLGWLSRGAGGRIIIAYLVPASAATAGMTDTYRPPTPKNTHTRQTTAKAASMSKEHDPVVEKPEEDESSDSGSDSGSDVSACACGWMS